MSSKHSESGPGPRDYKISEIKRLFALSRNQCMEPNCQNLLIAEDGKTVIAKICHIAAAKKGGPRFSESMNNDQRRSFDNLILLCDEHHQIIDNKENESNYPSGLIKEWKNQHISTDKKTEYKIKNKLLSAFINATDEYYKKVESIDGPYEPMSSEYYVNRGIESEFLTVLDEKGCLLLTGLSFCGKSEMAKYIAQNYFQQGYLYKRVLNVRDAASFLESVGADRICFLEDPFGHIVGEEDPNELKRLQDLLPNMQKNHLLIVTSRIEVVTSIFNQSNISECILGIHNWYDITSSDITFLLKVWHNVIDGKNIKMENIKNVECLLFNDKQLEPGQLAHLANLPLLRSEILHEERLFALAQINAEELRQSIKILDSFTWKVFLILGLTCDTINGCSYPDLLYIFDSNVKHLSLEPEGDLLISFEEKDINDFVFPNYTDDQNNIEDYERGIDILEERKYIHLENNRYVFKHPQYREIAKGLIVNLTSTKQRQMLSSVQNSFTCLNPDMALNISKNINFIIKNLNQSYVDQLISTVFKVSEKSYFPKVLDQCYLYLLKNFRSNNVEKYQDDLLYRLQSSSENSKISFINNQPIKWRQASTFSKFFISSKLPYSEILEKVKKGIEISSEEIWTTLLSKKRLNISLDIEFLEYAFKSSEVFIRNLTAYNYFLKVNEFSDSLLWNKIFSDDQPSVLFYALKGFFQGVPNNSKYLNEELKEKFLYFFKNNEIFCIRSSNLMTNFSTDYASDSINWNVVDHKHKFWIWRIWADCFIAFIKTFPNNAKFSHIPRFSRMMNDAKIFVYPKQAVNIAGGLLCYIEENLKTRIPNNFEMHLIDFLIDTTKHNPLLRQSVFKKLITNNYTTTFNGYNLCWAVGRWSLLEKFEKELIIDLIKSSRIDVEWLKAILINSCLQMPQELQQIIFKNRNFLSQTIENIIAKTPKPLLEKMIIVYSGKDGALQEIGISESNDKIREITRYISKNNLQIEYETCALLLLTDILNGVRKQEWKSVKDYWFQTIQNCEQIDELVKLILNQVSRTSFIRKETRYVFKKIINKYFKDNRINYLATLIASKIEELTYTSGDQDVFYILNYKNFLTKFILPLIPRNHLLLNVLTSVDKGNMKSEEFKKYLNPIMQEKNETIHFLSIFELLKNIEDKNLLDNYIIKELKTIPNDINRRYEQHFDVKEQYKKLDDFIYFLN